MIVPILSYGAEIWACFGWRKQNLAIIEQYLMNSKHIFEKLQSKMCKNALGIRKNVPDHAAKAEMGTYPIMGLLVKRIFSYWQHVLASPVNTILSRAFQLSVSLDRNDKVSYYTRLKSLLNFLDMRHQIYQVPENQVKTYTNGIRNKFHTIFSVKYFRNMKMTGKTELYHQIKKTYIFEKYLDTHLPPELKRNLTAIRISGHCLPIERLRRMGIERSKRYCNLCVENEIGCEQHVLIYCKNKELITLRKDFKTKLVELNKQYQNFTMENIMKIQLLANDASTSYYFAVFLKKVFNLVNVAYSNKDKYTTS